MENIKAGLVLRDIYGRGSDLADISTIATSFLRSYNEAQFMKPTHPTDDPNRSEQRERVPREDGFTRQCSAHKSSDPSKRCKRAAAMGTTVCMYHGASAPQVIRAAKFRLLEMVDPALAGLLRVLAQKGACPTCGRTDDLGSITRAATAVLDRAGLGPRSVIELERGDGSGLWAQYLTDEQLAQINTWIAAAKEKFALEEGSTPPQEDDSTYEQTDAE